MKQCIAILLVLGTASAAWCGTYTWIGGAGNWDDPNNWNPNGQPSISAYGAVTAYTSGTVTVRGLGMTGMGPSATELDNGGTINIVSQSGSTPTLYVTSVLNNSGQINMSAGQFQVGNGIGVPPWNDPTIPITASGGGTISLTGGQLVITSPLTLNGQNIQGGGSGQINCPSGVGTCLTVLSGNLVQANGGGLVVALSGGSINNGGILQAVNGGTLQLAGGHWSQGATNVSGGTIQALNGSTVLLGYTNGGDYGAAGSVTGSTLNTFGTGVIQASEGMVLDGITNNGNINIVNVPGVSANNNFAVLANTITNVGTINLVSGNIFLTETSTPGNTTLTGGGIVNLDGYGISGQTGNGPNGTLTNVNNLIQGAGGISYTTLYNQSVINSNTNGQTLSITGSTINNSGILEASNGGTLQIGGGQYSGGPTYVNGGTIQALDGSTVLLGYTNPGDYDSPGTITGSTFNTAGSGVIQASEYVVLNGITNHGTLDVVTVPGVGGNVAILENTINNTGTITTVGGNIQLSGPVSLTGGGTVNLNGFHITGDPLTNVDNTIQTTQGTGWVDAQLTNQGTVRAGAGAVLSVGNLTNYSGGTLTGGTYDAVGTIWIIGSIVNNAATIILDGASSSIVYPPGGADALASTFADNQAAGTFEILDGRNFTTAGAFSNEGTIDVGAGSTLTIGVAFTNAGNLDINGTLIAPTIAIGAGQDLSGSGTIDGNVTVYGSTDPGNSPGILTINGDYTQASGSFLDIQLGGTGSGQFDQLNVNGNLSLAGTLDVLLWNGFVPGNGNTFDILNWTGTRTGSFGAIDYPTLSAGYYFESLWGANSLTLEVGYNGGAGTVPEPATCFLMGAGLLVGIYRWRARRPIG